MDDNLRTRNLKSLEHAAAALKSNGFVVSVFNDASAAVKSMLDMVGTGKRVGFGGSMTLAALGLGGKLEKAGNTLITHTPEMDRETRIKIWRAAQAADFYFASPQAVTMKGELVLLDGNGNRAAACSCGPGKTVLVAGDNKLAGNLELGLWRTRNIAAVANNIRLKRNNPCVKTGKCEDCSSPERICNVLTVLYKKPGAADIEVVLINEELGY